MVKVDIKYESLQKYIDGIVAKIGRGISRAVQRSSKKLATGYKKNMRNGLDATGAPLAAVKESTMDMPVRITSDKRIRRTVNPSASRALLATGAAAKSIGAKRQGRDEYTIASRTPRGNRILTSGAYPQLANSGIIKGKRVIRDPLTASDKQLDIVENEILNELDRVFR